MTLNVNTKTEWARNGTQFSPRSRADKCAKLPGGVYRFNATMAGWYLDLISNYFEFPFKVYSASDHIIDRICHYWESNGGSLGVLLNGTRGAGKTMTAQQLANRLIKKHDLPVLIVRNPIPLQFVFDALQQDMMIIFDEFEKTHDADAQQSLLSIIDGMNRSSNNRLIIFTTNITSINENFRDRPSRIHYQFEFTRVADEIIEGLVDDGLPPELLHLKSDIFDFLHTRKICTIDIVKAVISEVKTFGEPPREFEEMLNIAKGEPPAFLIEILDPDTNDSISTFSHYFKPDYAQYIAMLSGNKRKVQEFIDKGSAVTLTSRTWDGTCTITLLEKCKEEHLWVAKLKVPLSKTPFKDFDFLANEHLWLDNRPKNWSFPFSRQSVKNKEDEENLRTLYYACVETDTVYGTGNPAVFKIRIEPNHVSVIPSRWSVDGYVSD